MCSYFSTLKHFSTANQVKTTFKEEKIKEVSRIVWEELYSSRFSRCEYGNFIEVRNIAKVDIKVERQRGILDRKIYFSPEELPPPSIDLDLIDKTITIVLDFDETLIHVGVSSDETTTSEEEERDEEDVLQLHPPQEIKKPFVEGKWSYYLRPGVKEFLKNLKALGPNVEIISWTAAARIHAERVLTLIDPEMNLIDFCIVRSDKWFKDGIPGKDLTRLGYRCPLRMLIVDDSPTIPSFNSVYNSYILVPSFSPEGDSPFYFESFKQDTVLMTLYDAIERAYKVISVLDECSSSCCYEEIKNFSDGIIKGYKDHCYYSSSSSRCEEGLNILINNPFASYHNRYDVYIRNYGAGKPCQPHRHRKNGITFSDIVKCHPLVINVEIVKKQQQTTYMSAATTTTQKTFLQKIQNVFSSSVAPVSSDSTPSPSISHYCANTVDFIIDTSSPRFEILSSQILNVFVVGDNVLGTETPIMPSEENTSPLITNNPPPTPTTHCTEIP